MSDESIIRGQLALANGDGHEALEVFTRILNDSPRNAAAFQGRARAHLLLKDRPKAIADYDAAIRIDSNNTQFRVERAQELFKQRLHEKCLADCDAVLTHDESNPSILGLRGRCHDALGNSAAALKDLERAGTEFAPYLAKLRLELGECHEGEGI